MDVEEGASSSNAQIEDGSIDISTPRTSSDVFSDRVLSLVLVGGAMSLSALPLEGADGEAQPPGITALVNRKWIAEDLTQGVNFGVNQLRKALKAQRQLSGVEDVEAIPEEDMAWSRKDI